MPALMEAIERARNLPAVRRRAWADVRPVDRILARVELQPDGCLVVVNCSTLAGYAITTIKPSGRVRVLLAHRLVYESFVGPIPPGHHLHHTCRVRPCVNPEHLEPLSPVEHGAHLHGNTRCRKGHEFTPENTIPISSGRRCRVCLRARQREYNACQRDRVSGAKS